MVFVIEDYYDPRGKISVRPGEGEKLADEIAWHRFCFAIIHGIGEG